MWTTYDFALQGRRRALGRPVDPPPNVLVASIFGGQQWKEWLHPRDRRGRWIEKFSRVKVFDWGGAGSHYVGQVERLNRDGSVSVRITQGAHVGSVIKAKPSQLEESMARALLPSVPHPPPAVKVVPGNAPWSPNRPILTGSAAELGTTYGEVGRSLRERPVVTFDYETTGLHPEAGHRGVQVAAVRTVDGKVVDRFHSFMNPGRPIDPAASAVTGITDDKVKDAPSHVEVARQLRDFIGSDLVAAHNASFDLGFLQASLHDGGDPSWEPSGTVDTLSLARSILKTKAKGGPVDNHKLQTLADFFNVELSKAHAADADTEATARLLGALMRYAEEHGSTLPDMKSLEQKWKDALPEYYAKLDEWLST